MKALKTGILLVTILISSLAFAQTNTISSNGNVGIGTLNPSAKLDVNGRMVVDSMVIFKDSLCVQQQLTVEKNLSIKGESSFEDDGQFNSKLKVMSVARMKDKLIVDGLTKMNGNAKIFGNLSLKGLEDLSLTNNRVLGIQPNGLVTGVNIGGLFDANAQIACLATVDGTILARWTQKPNAPYGILYTGISCPTRVGIGIVNPLAPLHVGGRGLFGSLETGTGGVKVVVPNVSVLKAYSVLNSTTNQDVFSVMSDGSVNISVDMSQWSKPLRITDVTSGEDMFRVNSNGDIYATKITVRTMPFPDYVFKKDYNLMPLSELEAYIKVNKHLPNMPTAKNVEKDGADLGELNRILVEKTEELTLYVIELKKELDSLKDKVSQIKK